MLNIARKANCIRILINNSFYLQSILYFLADLALQESPENGKDTFIGG